MYYWYFLNRINENHIYISDFWSNVDHILIQEKNKYKDEERLEFTIIIWDFKDRYY